ncbi:hypothetical protein [Cerasicoccus arenae]|uniref:Uncharacterized protein n=1 Tax=Cerasicoccus arenae TaxID=424488 RepID=A0A8J3DJL7_9BACT|nr:hypothetical protein [Cerasicoccus arenae]MBK1859945.1 hypothetical protein [Cerasicoccus arenae]GHC08498.1 hypothetical protein GCM10007047_27250 [Cerasicoccus arenae]
MAITSVLVFSHCLLNAQTFNADDWYIVSSGDPTGISDGGTSTATINFDTSGGSTNARNSYIWSYFAEEGSEVSLADGMQLTLTTSITVDYNSASSAILNGFRFGFYDSASPHQTPATAGANRIGAPADARDGWTGSFTSTVTSGAGSVFRKDVGNDAAFANSVSTTTDGLDSGVLNKSYTNGVPVSLTMIYGRIGDDMIMSGSYGGDAFSGTFTDYFASDYPSTFDTIGFFLGSQGTGGATAESMTFSDAIVTYGTIPEPSTNAAIVGIMAFGLVVLVHRKQRR